MSPTPLTDEELLKAVRPMDFEELNDNIKGYVSRMLLGEQFLGGRRDAAIVLEFADGTHAVLLYPRNCPPTRQDLCRALEIRAALMPVEGTA